MFSIIHDEPDDDDDGNDDDETSGAERMSESLRQVLVHVLVQPSYTIVHQLRQMRELISNMGTLRDVQLQWLEALDGEAVAASSPLSRF